VSKESLREADEVIRRKTKSETIGLKTAIAQEEEKGEVERKRFLIGK
jgi:hypothetical protein